MSNSYFSWLSAVPIGGFPSITGPEAPWKWLVQPFSQHMMTDHRSKSEHVSATIKPWMFQKAMRCHAYSILGVSLPQTAPLPQLPHLGPCNRRTLWSWSWTGNRSETSRTPAGILKHQLLGEFSIMYAHADYVCIYIEYILYIIYKYLIYRCIINLCSYLYISIYVGLVV